MYRIRTVSKERPILFQSQCHAARADFLRSDGPAIISPPGTGPITTTLRRDFARVQSVNPGGLMGKIFGKGASSRRRGHGLRRFGSELITQFDQFGSQGLATTLGNPKTSYNFTTAPRYDGAPASQPAARLADSHIPRPTSPRLSARPGISPDLKAPFSYLRTSALRASCRAADDGDRICRPALPNYCSRAISTRARTFKDSVSGQNLDPERDGSAPLNDSGLTPTAVQSTRR